MDKATDETAGGAAGSAAMPWWLAPWLGGGGGVVAAPRQLDQPILPGWSFLSVTNQNSSKPETERAIVAEQSYGRQIGVIMEALCTLIGPIGDDAPAAYVKLRDLSRRVDRIKIEAAERRVAQLGEDLAELKACLAPDDYARRLAALRALLDG